MPNRIRKLAGMLAAAALVAAGAVTPSAANVPQRETGTLNCHTDASGHASISFTPGLTGVAAFEGFNGALVTGVSGADAESLNGGTWFEPTTFATTVAGVTQTLDVEGPPSTDCAVGYGVDEVPTNDEYAAAELLTGSSGSVDGSTRAATLVTDEPQPMPDVNRVVWYRWTAPTTGKVVFEVEPIIGASSYLDAGTIFTALCFAVYNSSQPFTPLIVGGNAVADGNAAYGGLGNVAVTAGAEYRVAVCSGGGTADFASAFGYTAPGAFSLTWTYNRDPEAHDDVAQTTGGAPVTIDVLANDTDPDSDPRQVVSTTLLTSSGATIARDALDPNLIVYTPAEDSPQYDYFTYDISDGSGGTDRALVTVYNDIAIPPPSPIEITPSLVDFGAVPLGKTADVDVTITNTSEDSEELVGPWNFDVAQSPPGPFEPRFFGSTCSGGMPAGNSCTLRVRFWSIAGADDASPATLTLRDAFTHDLVATAPLFASTAPPVPPGTPNSAPDAVDDLIGAAVGFDHTFNPLANDTDPDNDQLRIIDATGAQHGTIGGIVPCDSFPISPHNTCVRYTPDPAFIGIDEIDYTIEDGRGGTDTATMYIALASFTARPHPRIDTVTPAHGPAPGGHTVTIDGANFLPGAGLTFTCNGLEGLAATTFVSTTQLTATVPPLPAAATCDVTVREVFNLSGSRRDAYTVDGGQVPTVVPSSATVSEGDTGTKTLNVPVSLSAPSSQTVTVQWNTLRAPGAPDGQAETPGDYAAASGVVTFAPGETDKTVPITINGDALDEVDNEYIIVSFHDPTNAVMGGFWGLGFGVIADDDAMPVLVPDVSGPPVAEGNSGQQSLLVRVNLSAPSGRTVTAHWTTLALAGAGLAEPADFVAASGIVSFAPGETSKTVPISINGDTIPEEAEAVVVSFHHPTNATIGGVWGLGATQILNDD